MSQKKVISALFWASLFTCGGCLFVSVQKTEPQVIYVPGPTTRSVMADLESRYSAASQISSVSARDDAMNRLTLDAAAAADVQMTHQALQSISGVSQRDSTAQEAASILSQRGLRGDAIAVAQEISSVSERDETLAKLSAHQLAHPIGRSIVNGNARPIM